MADNVTFQTTVATPPDATVVATDDVGGAQYQRVKVDAGGNGVSVPIVAGAQVMAASVPVVIASDQTAIPISGTITATVTGGATAAKQDTGNTSLASIDGKITAVNTGAVVISSGSVTANAGTNLNTSALALEATLSSLNAKVTAVNTGAVVVASGSITAVQPTGTNLHTVIDSGTITTVSTVSSVTAIAGALPAGNNNIGDVDVASVTGNVTVVQGTGSNLHTVVDSGTITTVSSVTAIANALPAGNNNIGDVDVASVTGNVTVVQGTGTNLHVVTDTTSTTAVTQGTATNLKAEVIGAGTAGTANAGVVTVQGIASMTPVQVSQATASSLNAQAVGNIAHDAADSGNPLKIGAKAYSPDGTTPGTAVAEGDRSDAKSDLDGRVFVNPYSPLQKHKHLDGSSAYTDQEVAADPGDGFQVVLTNIIVGTNAATAMKLFLEEGSTKIFGPYGLEAVAGRGFCSGPIYLPITASTAVTITTSANIAQAVDIDYFVQAV